MNVKHGFKLQYAVASWCVALGDMEETAVHAKVSWWWLSSAVLKFSARSTLQRRLAFWKLVSTKLLKLSNEFEIKVITSQAYILMHFKTIIFSSSPKLWGLFDVPILDWFESALDLFRADLSCLQSSCLCPEFEIQANGLWLLFLGNRRVLLIEWIKVSCELCNQHQNGLLV